MLSATSPRTPQSAFLHVLVAHHPLFAPDPFLHIRNVWFLPPQSLLPAPPKSAVPSCTPQKLYPILHTPMGGLSLHTPKTQSLPAHPRMCGPFLHTPKAWSHLAHPKTAVPYCTSQKHGPILHILDTQSVPALTPKAQSHFAHPKSTVPSCTCSPLHTPETRSCLAHL